MSQMFAGDVFEAARVSKLGQRLQCESRGQQEERGLQCNLLEKENRFRRLADWTGELNEKDIVSLAFELFDALPQVQHKIRSDGELSLFEFLQATIDCFRIAVYEKNAEQTGSMGMCSLCGRIACARLFLLLIPL